MKRREVLVGAAALIVVGAPPAVAKTTPRLQDKSRIAFLSSFTSFSYVYIVFIMSPEN